MLGMLILQGVQVGHHAYTIPQQMELHDGEAICDWLSGRADAVSDGMFDKFYLSDKIL